MRKLTEGETARLLAKHDASAAVLAFLVDLAIALEARQLQADAAELADAGRRVLGRQRWRELTPEGGAE